MAGNNDPIYSKVGLVQSSGVVQAVSSFPYSASGTLGTDAFIVWTADSTNGGYIQKLRVKYVGNSTTSSNACVMKVFVTSVASGSVTDSTMFLIDEIAIPATGTLTTTTTNPSYDIPMGFALPPGWNVVVRITVAQPASFGFVVTGFGGKY